MATQTLADAVADLSKTFSDYEQVRKSIMAWSISGRC